MNKGKISNFLRQSGFLPVADKLQFYLEKFRNRKINRNFVLENPGVQLPPDYLIYESFQLNYKKYYVESEETAQWLIQLLKKHTRLTDIKILDWGCGPGRVIRHLPRYIGGNSEFYGTDYNVKSIKWCTKNLPDIQFNHNTLAANLPYNNHFFDVIYGISIFTHLSEEMHYNWYAELLRVLKPGGIMLVTAQGKNFKRKLSAAELERFNSGELVVRGNVKEGHRTFSAFHPAQFMRKLFSDAGILEHIVREPAGNGWLPQDIWIIKKAPDEQ